MEIGWTESLKTTHPKWRNSIVLDIFKPYSKLDVVYMARLLQKRDTLLGSVVIKQSELTA